MVKDGVGVCRVIRGEVFHQLRAVKLHYLKAKLAASENGGKKTLHEHHSGPSLCLQGRQKKKEKNAIVAAF